MTILDTFSPLRRYGRRNKEQAAGLVGPEEQATPCLLISDGPRSSTRSLLSGTSNAIGTMLRNLSSGASCGWPTGDTMGWRCPISGPIGGPPPSRACWAAAWMRPPKRPLGRNRAVRHSRTLEVDLQPESRFYRTVMAVTARATALSSDRFFVAVYPIVGIADILATLCGTEQLLVAMADQPTAVTAAMRHVTDLWLRTFHQVQDLIQTSGNPGTMNWMAIWAPGTSCCTQEDFSYMISDEMFRDILPPPLAGGDRRL